MYNTLVVWFYIQLFDTDRLVCLEVLFNLLIHANLFINFLLDELLIITKNENVIKKNVTFWARSR